MAVALDLHSKVIPTLHVSIHLPSLTRYGHPPFTWKPQQCIFPALVIHRHSPDFTGRTWQGLKVYKVIRHSLCPWQSNNRSAFDVKNLGSLDTSILLSRIGDVNRCSNTKRVQKVTANATFKLNLRCRCTYVWDPFENQWCTTPCRSDLLCISTCLSVPQR